jgi:hypothetical protein
VTEAPSGIAFGGDHEQPSLQHPAIVRPSGRVRGADSPHAEASYHWSFTFSGGTLYLDDLIFIEQLAEQEGASATWELAGDRDLGIVSIEAETLRDLCAERLEVPEPRLIAFHYGPRHDHDGSYDGYAWLEMKTNHVRGETEIAFEVGGHPRSSPTFGRIVSGLSNRLRLAERRTAVQRGHGLGALLRPPLASASGMLFVVWVVSVWIPVALRLTGDDLGSDLNLAADLLPLGAFGAWLALQPVTHRLSALERWRAAGPIFDLSHTRPATEPRPPTFWRGEYGRWWPALLSATVVGIAGFGISLYLGISGG